MNTSIRDDLRGFQRSWIHHTGTQLATLTVLTATFSVLTFVFVLSMNLKHILLAWGGNAQLTVYLAEDVDSAHTDSLRKELEALPDFNGIEYTPREAATAKFKAQMAGYAPDLLADADFSNPFPSSFRLSLKSALSSDADVARLEALAKKIGKMAGVEDVSFGQNWVRGYSAFISSIDASGGVIALILIAGSLLVIGNSIRLSISGRREEIEIMELVGATTSMIRRPFVAEGVLTGALAATIALILCFVLHSWEKSALASSLSLSGVVPMMHFLNPFAIFLLICVGAGLGGFGAWITVRGINDGWSASQSVER